MKLKLVTHMKEAKTRAINKFLDEGGVKGKGKKYGVGTKSKNKMSKIIKKMI